MFTTAATIREILCRSQLFNCLPEGNILVDSPRFVAPRMKNIEAMGGIRYLYLTHRDDVADHQQYHDHFGCDRILHADEINAGTRSVEIQLSA